MKILVAYYSRTKFTKKVAEIIVAKLEADTEEIIDTKNRQGALGYLSAAKDATMRKTTVIEDLAYDPKDFDLVVIGTPIWSWNVSSPIRTYLRHNKEKFKKVAFFSTMGGSGDQRAFADMAKECGLGPVAELSLLTKEVAQNDLTDKVNEFVKNLQ